MKEVFKKLLVNNFTINSYYGGFGNNLQQIALGVMFSNLKNKNFYTKDHPLVSNFSVINNRFSNILSKYRFDSRFYHFENINEKFTNSPETDKPLINEDMKFYNENFYETFQKFIEPNLNFKKKLYLDDDLLVIHIRSGDIFAKKKEASKSELDNYAKLNNTKSFEDFSLDDNKNNIVGNYYYLQNPLVYYKELIDKYDQVILVSSKPFNNPVINELKNFKNVKLLSSTLAEDFNILLNAKNLATSGVGTFAIAAALASKDLKNLYYSNIFFNHHLNPTMVKNVNHHMYRFNNYFDIGDEWNGSSEQINKLLSNKIEIFKNN
jgi:hypothetical protein|tara:strand:+ start:4037 stop:5002 length:966 start_codon:yes stop_codon:yes gene_type:complete